MQPGLHKNRTSYTVSISSQQIELRDFTDIFLILLAIKSEVSRGRQQSLSALNTMNFQHYHHYLLLVATLAAGLPLNQDEVSEKTSTEEIGAEKMFTDEKVEDDVEYVIEEDKHIIQDDVTEKMSSEDTSTEEIGIEDMLSVENVDEDVELVDDSSFTEEQGKRLHSDDDDYIVFPEDNYEYNEDYEDNYEYEEVDDLDVTEEQDKHLYIVRDLINGIFRGRDRPRCRRVYETQYTTRYERRCRTSYRRQCDTSQEEECSTGYRTEYEWKCSPSDENNCPTSSEFPVETCDNEGGGGSGDCRYVPVKKLVRTCNNVPVERCYQVPVQNCSQVPVKKRIKVAKRVCYRK